MKGQPQRSPSCASQGSANIQLFTDPAYAGRHGAAGQGAPRPTLNYPYALTRMLTMSQNLSLALTQWRS